MKVPVSDMPKSTSDAGFARECSICILLIGKACIVVGYPCVISSSTDFDVRFFTFLFRVGRVGVLPCFCVIINSRIRGAWEYQGSAQPTELNFHVAKRALGATSLLVS